MAGSITVPGIEATVLLQFQPPVLYLGGRGGEEGRREGKKGGVLTSIDRGRRMGPCLLA